jgi:hypothetical protein
VKVGISYCSHKPLPKCALRGKMKNGLRSDLPCC